MEGTAQAAAELAAACVLAAGAATDAGSRSIPNAVPGLLAAGLAALWLAAGIPEDAGARLAMAGAGLAVLLAGYRMGQCGGGDVKLTPATLAWVDPAHWTPYFLGFAGICIAMVAWACLPLAAARRHREALPLGVAIAAPAAVLLIHDLA